MTGKELKLVADLLDLASDEFSNHGCYDVDDSLYEGWTKKEKTELCKYGCMVNNDPDEYEDGDEIAFDWVLMYVLAEKIRSEINDRQRKV